MSAESVHLISLSDSDYVDASRRKVLTQECCVFIDKLLSKLPPTTVLYQIVQDKLTSGWNDPDPSKVYGDCGPYSTKFEYCDLPVSKDQIYYKIQLGFANGGSNITNDLHDLEKILDWTPIYRGAQVKFLTFSPPFAEHQLNLTISISHVDLVKNSGLLVQGLASAINQKQSICDC